MKKKILVVAVMAAMAFSLTGCGVFDIIKDKVEDIVEATEATEAPAVDMFGDNTTEGEIVPEADSTEDTDSSGSAIEGSGDVTITAEDDITVTVGSDSKEELHAGYSRLVGDMENLIKQCQLLNEEYLSCDYMYFDYDEDGIRELMFYLGYYKAEDTARDTYLRDVIFFDYFPARGEIGIKGIFYGDINDQSFYSEYKGKMAKYSWISVDESYLDIVVSDENSVSLQREGTYNELFIDLPAHDLYPLPLYGSWEIILPEENLED